MLVSFVIIHHLSMKSFEDQNQEVWEPDVSGTYTARDYITWKTEEMMELLLGKIFKMSPAPSSVHQQIVMNLGNSLYTHFKKSCKVFPAPYDVYLVKSGENWKETKNILQPDLCVICEASKVQHRGCIGAPDLVVEILSPSTAAKDLGIKRDLYEEYGVKEMWIIHPHEATVAVHVLENGKYRILPLYSKGETIQSPTFAELKVDLNDVFIEDLFNSLY